MSFSFGDTLTSRKVMLLSPCIIPDKKRVEIPAFASVPSKSAISLTVQPSTSLLALERGVNNLRHRNDSLFFLCATT